MAFSIIRHAFRMIFGNFWQALRLSVGPFALVALIFYVLARVLNIGMVSVVFMMMSPTRADPVIVAFVICAIVAGITVTGWVAVAWHRFILKEEYVRILPRFDRRTWRYLVKSFQIGLVVMFVAFCIGFVGGMLLAITGLAEVWIFPTALGFAISTVASYLSFRMGLALPAAAVDGGLGLGDSMRLTLRLKGIIWQVVFILIFINVIARGVSMPFTSAPVALQIGIATAAGWLTMMLGLSVLTTFYGHLVENRPLADTVTPAAES